MSKLTLEQVGKLIESYKDSDIHKYYSKHGEGKASGYAVQKLYAKTESGNKKLSDSARMGSNKAKVWRQNNKQQSTKISKLGGYTSKQLGVGIHGMTKEQRIEHAKYCASIAGFSQMTKEEQTQIGKKYGKKNLLKKMICEECGKEVNRGNYHQFHGNKCREKKKKDLLNLLPDTFTSVDLRNVAKENGINIKGLNILHHTSTYVKCIKSGSNQFNPGVYKKI